MNPIPASFKETVIRIFQETGREWLSALPGLLEQCRAKWNLEILKPVADLSINYITAVKSAAGKQLILKIGVPHRELYTETAALRLYNGRHFVRLIDADRDLGAILMQRVVPGSRLCDSGTNAEQTKIAGTLFRDLSLPVPGNPEFFTYSGWLAGAFRGLRKTHGPDCGPLSADLVAKAEHLFAELKNNSGKQVLLHGDLHHENILFDDRRGWVAIDPKGVIGPACMETGRFMFNQITPGTPIPDVRRIITERTAILSDILGLKKTIVLASTLIDHVLSLTWALEDAYVGENWYYGQEVAKLVSGMIQTAEKKKTAVTPGDHHLEK